MPRKTKSLTNLPLFASTAGHILSVETNTFVESTKQNVEFKKSICGVHEIIAQDGKKEKGNGLALGKKAKNSTQPSPSLEFRKFLRIWPNQQRAKSPTGSHRSH